jgi:hypothetical protein
MKFVLATLFVLSSVSAYSADLKSTLSQIEFDRNAKCMKTGESFLNLCLGNTPGAIGDRCTRTLKYTCISNSKDFKLKIRVVEDYNTLTRSRETKVLKISYQD